MKRARSEDEWVEEDPRVHYVTRLNWAGLGVVEVEGRERCVPLTQVGERVQVRWRHGPWGQVIGERIDEASVVALFEAKLGCDQALRCSGCSLRHLSDLEQQTAQEESHRGALERLSGRDLSGAPSDWLQGPQRDGYRARVNARLTQSPPSESAHSRWALALRPRWGAPVHLARCPNHPVVLRALVSAVEDWINDFADSLSTILPQADTSASASEERPARDHFELHSVSIQAGDGLPHWVTLSLEAPRREGSLKQRERTRRLQIGAERWSTLPLEALQARLCLAIAQVDPSRRGVSVFGEARLRDQGRSAIGPTLLSGELDTRWRCPRGRLFEARPPAWLPQTPSTLESLRAGVSQLIWDGTPQRAPEMIFEIGCGVGLISVALLLEHPTLSWVGVDIEPMSTRCAEVSAKLNQVSARSQWIAEDGRRALAAADQVPDLLIIHAMRRPISGLLKLAAHRGIQRICYLAPSAPALGRDLAEAEEYEVSRLLYLDQMPGTATLMTIAALSLKRVAEGDVDA